MPDRFTMSPSPVLGGSTITICFTNIDLANTTVTIPLNDGGSGSDSVDIDLDANGYGCVGFTVPAIWLSVIATHSTSQDHAVAVG